MKYGKKPENSTSRNITDYLLTEAAKEDLIGIAQYGDEHFGVVQSNRYRDQFKHRFLILSETPFLYPAVDHICPGYRRSVCGSHSIYYRIDPNVIVVMRILGREDPATQL